jgi:hypothetical protein
MKATPILAGAGLLPYDAWSTDRNGIVRRLTLHARNQEEALAQAFAMRPDSTAMSVREADRGAPRDALADLARRAEDRGSP